MSMASLFKAEMAKNFHNPIFEAVVGVLFFSVINSMSGLISIFAIEDLQFEMHSLIAENIIYSLFNLDFTLSLFCSILIAISFARDYEQGLLQTLMSLPLSRVSIAFVKLSAVIGPLTVLTWFVILLGLSLDLYFSLGALLMKSLPLILVIFFNLTVYCSLSTLVALAVKRTLPSVLVSSILVLAINMMSKTGIIRSQEYVKYLLYLPPNASLMFLNMILGVQFLPSFSSVLLRDLSQWHFAALTIAYASVSFLVAVVFFKLKFEVRG